jgi:putative glutamine amidotransferase
VYVTIGSHALPHLDISDPYHRHALVVERGTLMERACGEGEVVVSSRHHRAVDEVAPGFAVTARRPDGVVEAIESTTDWLAVGTQFHPEDLPLGRCVFRQFVAAIVARRHAVLGAVA